MIKANFQMTEETNKILEQLKEDFKSEGKTITELFKQMIISFSNKRRK